MILKRLQEAGLQVDINKNKFHKKNTKFLKIVIRVNDI